MADDKDDNDLKKAEEALKKAEKNPAFVGPQDSPKFKAAVKQLQKARENFEAAGGVSDSAPAIREVLDIPPAPTAPTSPSDQVRNAMVGMRPEGNLGELPQLPEGRPEAAGAGLIQTKAEVIAEDAKTKKRRERQSKQQAKQLREDKKLGAANLATVLAEEKKNAETAARRSEKERQIIEKHDKNKPSAWEMGFATMTGGLGGLLFGTYKRYSKASRAAEVQIAELRRQNKLTDAAMGRAVTSARTGRAAASVRDKIWSDTDEQESADASSIFTHNIWKPYINPQDSKGNRVNILVGLDNNIFKPGDSYEKNVEDIEKVYKKAAKHNPKAVLLARKINSRILGVMKDNAEKVSTEDKFAWNKERLTPAVYESFPDLFTPDMRESVTNNINWADTDAVYDAMASNAKLAATHSLFDALAASKDRKFDKFKKRWRDVLANEKGVLSNSEALDNLLSETVADSNAIWNNLEVFETLQEGSNIAATALENAKLNGKPPKEIARLEEEFKASKARQELAATIAGKTGMELVVNDDGSWGVRSEASAGPSLLHPFQDKEGHLRWGVDLRSISKLRGSTPAETIRLQAEAKAEAIRMVQDANKTPPMTLATRPLTFDELPDPAVYNAWKLTLTEEKLDDYAATFDSVIKRVNAGDITLDMVRSGADVDSKDTPELQEKQRRLLGDGRIFLFVTNIIDAQSGD